MALGRAFSVAVRGLDGEIVEIEADISSGLPGVHLVGLPDAALQESRDRVRAAITNCGNRWPMARLTLALSPATLPKVGSVYDLAKVQARRFYCATRGARSRPKNVRLIHPDRRLTMRREKAVAGRAARILRACVPLVQSQYRAPQFVQFRGSFPALESFA